MKGDFPEKCPILFNPRSLGDFGRVFAHTAYAVTPTVYGPISFQLHLSTLLEAEDVAICLRSAGAQGFDRHRESLTSATDLDDLFCNPSSSSFPDNQEMKFGNSLQFTQRLGAQWPEVSCTVSSGRLSFAGLVVIWVDPYVIDGYPFEKIMSDGKISSTLREIVMGIHQAGLSYQLDRYLRYLRSGTVMFKKNAKENLQ